MSVGGALIRPPLSCSAAHLWSWNGNGSRRALSTRLKDTETASTDAPSASISPVAAVALSAAATARCSTSTDSGSSSFPIVVMTAALPVERARVLPAEAVRKRRSGGATSPSSSNTSNRLDPVLDTCSNDVDGADAITRPTKMAQHNRGLSTRGTAATQRVPAVQRPSWRARGHNISDGGTSTRWHERA